jgi:hypothetical protein
VFPPAFLEGTGRARSPTAISRFRVAAVAHSVFYPFAVSITDVIEIRTDHNHFNEFA